MRRGEKECEKKKLCIWVCLQVPKKRGLFTLKKNDMSTRFLQQILSGRLLLVVIIGVKK